MTPNTERVQFGKIAKDTRMRWKKMQNTLQYISLENNEDTEWTYEKMLHLALDLMEKEYAE